MINKITFIPANKDVTLLTEPPKPARIYVPDWYKSIPSITKTLSFDSEGFVNSNLKNCMPFLDTLMSGYIQETWTEINIENNNSVMNYHFATSPEILSHREHASLPIDDQYYNFEFVWRQVWLPKLPKGYSLLLTHPLNRLELPFTTVTGIIDADDFNYSFEANIPFYVKKGFSGIIPVGTPMYQMIPFKRESWESQLEEYNEDRNRKGYINVRKHFIGSYKNKYWKKKEYK